MAPEAFFLPAPSGQRFCLYHPPAKSQERERVALLFVHPFADEMNKSRRMVALQSRALAAAGHGVLQMDLLGCGDSSGDFADATWSAWVEDICLASSWLRKRCPAPQWLWGMRAGCLVAAEAARGLPDPVNFLFWQPTPSGRLYLQQFLRLGMAGALREGDSRGVTQKLRQSLAAGVAVEVGGYTLPPALAAGLEKAELTPAERSARLVWLEVATEADVPLAPAAQHCLATWAGAGHRTRSLGVEGLPFWQTVESTESPALLAATLAALSEEIQA